LSDLCPEMVEKTRRNALLLGLRNVEFVQAEIEMLPLPERSLDVVISNGVFNLCPDKPSVLAEAFRVLRPGGRLQMADILLHDDVTPQEVAKEVQPPDKGIRTHRLHARRAALPAGRGQRRAGRQHGGGPGGHLGPNAQWPVAQHPGQGARGHALAAAEVRRRRMRA
jgi:SAM-dependent methyltransferase